MRETFRRHPRAWAAVLVLTILVCVAGTEDFGKGLQGQIVSVTTAGTTYSFSGGRTMALFFRNQTGSAGRVCIGVNVDASAVQCDGTDADFSNGHIVIDPGESFRAAAFTSGKIGLKAETTGSVWVLVSKP